MSSTLKFKIRDITNEKLSKYYLQTFRRVLFPGKLTAELKSRIDDFIFNNRTLDSASLIAAVKDYFRNAKVFDKDLENHVFGYLRKERKQQTLDLSKYIDFVKK